MANDDLWTLKTYAELRPGDILDDKETVISQPTVGVGAGGQPICIVRVRSRHGVERSVMGSPEDKEYVTTATNWAIMEDREKVATALIPEQWT